MNSRAVSFLVFGSLVATASYGCGDPNSATETNVFRCTEDDLVDGGDCDAGAEETPPEGVFTCDEDKECPSALPICNSNHVCSPKRG